MKAVRYLLTWSAPELEVLRLLPLCKLLSVDPEDELVVLGVELLSE